MLGTYMAIRLSIRNSLKLNFINENSFMLTLGSLLGARLFGIIFNYQAYFQSFSVENLIQFLRIWDGGLSGWGALVGFFLSLYYISKKSEQDFFKWADAIVPSVIFAAFFYHLGAFFDGRNYGNETSLPWGVQFENITVKFAVPIHPTQTYAALYSIAIATALIILIKHPKIKEKKTGFIALIGTSTYSFCYFIEQFARGDDTLLLFGIRAPQILSLIVSILTGIFLFMRYYYPTNFKK